MSKKTMSIAELETVVLEKDLPEHGLCRGDLGVVVQVYETAAELEFVTASGRTQAVVTLGEADFRPVGDRDLMAVRSIARGAA